RCIRTATWLLRCAVRGSAASAPLHGSFAAPSVAPLHPHRYRAPSLRRPWLSCIRTATWLLRCAILGSAASARPRVLRMGVAAVEWGDGSALRRRCRCRTRRTPRLGARGRRDREDVPVSVVPRRDRVRHARRLPRREGEPPSRHRRAVAQREDGADESRRRRSHAKGPRHGDADRAGRAEVIALILVLAACFGLLVFMWVSIGREPGPSAADVAVAYERAWDDLDFSLVYDLSGPEMRDGMHRDRFVAT